MPSRYNYNGNRAKTTSLLFLLLVASGTAVSAFALFNWQRSKKLLRDGPKKAPKKAKRIVFGFKEGENRGPDVNKLMNPPIEVEDPYHYLRDDDRKDPEVLGLIKEENLYADVCTKHLKKFQKNLYEDLLRHLKQTDESVPYPWGSYFYYSRTVEGKSYPIKGRKASLEADAPEEVILDYNLLAKGHKYLDVGDWEPSPKEHALLGYSVDYTGGETYDIHFKALANSKQEHLSLVKDVIPETSGSFVWGADSSVVYYEKLDSNHRPYQLWRHEMGTPTEDDVLLFTEEDERLWMGISKTDSGRFLILSLSGKQQNEQWVLDLKDVKGAAEHAARSLALIEKRATNQRYSVEHHGEFFYIITNQYQGKEMLESMLVRAPLAGPGSSNWEPCFPYNPAEQLKHLTCFESHIVIHGRANGYAQFWIYEPPAAAAAGAGAGAGGSKKKEGKGKSSASGEQQHKRTLVTHEEDVFCVYGSVNAEFNSGAYRYEYSSLTCPRKTIDINLGTLEKTVLKQVEVPFYDPTRFACERLLATAHDGRQIPLSVVYKKSLLPEGGKSIMDVKEPLPTYLYGYGSYGSSIDAAFDSNRLALLNRGVVYVIAHIRGGGEMGRAWYEKEGKFLTKQNTFKDFCSSAEFLVAAGITAPDRLAISGASAGGLLITACLNMRGSSLFKVAVADVPFCDVLCTMMDSTIPLTVVEWEEWGNVNEKQFFDYIKEYCPVTNIQAQDYPSILALGGLNDPRVAYWEPLKYVKKLREMKTDSNPLLLKIDMSAGHFSASDRYKYLKEKAFIFSFVLDQLGIKE